MWVFFYPKYEIKFVFKMVKKHFFKNILYNLSYNKLFFYKISQKIYLLNVWRQNVEFLLFIMET